MLVGVWMVDKYVHDDPNGDSLALHMQEGMENWIGLLKQLCIGHVRSNKGWLKRLLKYFDLYVIAGIQQDIVDFRITKNNCVHHKNLIYDDNETPQMIFEVKNIMPASCLEFIDLIEQIQFNRPETIDPHLRLIRFERIPESMRNRINVVSDAMERNMHLFMIDADTPTAAVSHEDIMNDWESRPSLSKAESLVFYGEAAGVQYDAMSLSS